MSHCATGLQTTLEGGGDVSVVPQDNAQTLETFRSGAIDGAWVPEPWATRLILEGGAKVLVDERNLWPKQSFTTTILIVRTEFLEKRPDLVEALLAGQINAIDYLQQNPVKGQNLVNDGIGKITGRKLTTDTIANSWVNLTFTNDPELGSMKVAADHAVEVGLLAKVDLAGIEDLSLLNKVLTANGKTKVVE
jgi:NitT/TauT family transport system substrate-binding protein